MDIISVPLHRINLKSDLISRYSHSWSEAWNSQSRVCLWLLGNDLAGGKVLPQPIVTRDPLHRS